MFKHTGVCTQAVEGTLALAVVPACDHGVEELAETQLTDTPAAVLAHLRVAAHHLQDRSCFESLIGIELKGFCNKNVAVKCTHFICCIRRHLQQPAAKTTKQDTDNSCHGVVYIT